MHGAPRFPVATKERGQARMPSGAPAPLAAAPTVDGLPGASAPLSRGGSSAIDAPAAATGPVTADGRQNWRTGTGTADRSGILALARLLARREAATAALTVSRSHGGPRRSEGRLGNWLIAMLIVIIAAAAIVLSLAARHQHYRSSMMKAPAGNATRHE